MRDKCGFHGRMIITARISPAFSGAKCAMGRQITRKEV